MAGRPVIIYVQGAGTLKSLTPGVTVKKEAPPKKE